MDSSFNINRRNSAWSQKLSVGMFSQDQLSRCLQRMGDGSLEIESRKGSLIIRSQRSLSPDERNVHANKAQLTKLMVGTQSKHHSGVSCTSPTGANIQNPFPIPREIAIADTKHCKFAIYPQSLKLKGAAPRDKRSDDNVKMIPSYLENPNLTKASLFPPNDKLWRTP
ncbi:hypothetical protein CGMCC3_g3337 [Colletotrichum fructicola]|nr:uncharacterized protein CGMCC3_g3337 [Colletotrichum fructicola]KAE9580524.1 hypothetical protein CGMCC3_g3337 [Colletotrichum fructicola]